MFRSRKNDEGDTLIYFKPTGWNLDDTKAVLWGASCVPVWLVGFKINGFMLRNVPKRLSHPITFTHSFVISWVSVITVTWQLFSITQLSTAYDRLTTQIPQERNSISRLSTTETETGRIYHAVKGDGHRFSFVAEDLEMKLRSGRENTLLFAKTSDSPEEKQPIRLTNFLSKENYFVKPEYQESFLADASLSINVPAAGLQKMTTTGEMRKYYHRKNCKIALVIGPDDLEFLIVNISGREYYTTPVSWICPLSWEIELNETGEPIIACTKKSCNHQISLRNMFPTVIKNENEIWVDFGSPKTLSHIRPPVSATFILNCILSGGKDSSSETLVDETQEKSFSNLLPPSFRFKQL